MGPQGKLEGLREEFGIGARSGFFLGILEISAGEKEVLVAADTLDFSAIWRPARARRGFRRGAVHLHYILGVDHEDTGLIGVLSR